MVNIEAFKNKFKSTLEGVDKNMADVKKDLDREFNKLRTDTIEKGSYQEKVTQDQQNPIGHSRNK